MQFLNTKGWHVNTIANQKKVWMAQQREKEGKKRAEEREKQLKEERTRFEARSQGLSGKDLERARTKDQLSFLYDVPKELLKHEQALRAKREEDRKKATEKETESGKEGNPEGNDDDDGEGDEGPEWAKHAPTQGSYTKGLANAVRHKPLGVLVRNVRCIE
eukprot:TRINITY_DN1437_c0_g1_i2.p1 TRINITY_DN1437_c0_g1~~TRINITY_DN1437_c0_g1_i2.p1  ORF type:complete len:161 (+),score=37.11 TRINITY_DN1437_c0_g1_i2:30-512(+)